MPHRITRRLHSGLLRALAAVAVAACAAMATAPSARAETREYELVVDEGTVTLAGVPRHALTINGSVPGPTLRFTVGDDAVIHVRNELDVETSVHWHGLLVPNDQDGVPHLTTPPIAAGTTFTYRFPIRHSGTYWYHSHTGLQEQQGVYGSIVIHPREGEPVKVDREHVVVLSDWTDEDPWEVMRTLMRGSDWYGVRKGTLPTLVGAWRAGRMDEYLNSLWNRMPPMDVSDVAYDAFLANGEERLVLDGAPGETLRLRFINASASTNFFLQSALGPLTVIAADGPAVRPAAVDGFLFAIAETYDLLVTVPTEGLWEIRATAQDATGWASIFVGSGTEHPARTIPAPDLYSMEHLMAGAMESTGMGRTVEGAPPPARPLSPYRLLRAAEPSRAREGAPKRTLELRLTGDMVRYIWSFNGKTLAEEMTIPVNRGEVLRLELVNDTMMHHPLHLHGHFFRVLDGDDEEAPLKHTVDVPPMGRRTIEFDANETGDWLFHCHVLYHMDAGMTRVFTYGPPDRIPPMDPGMLGMTMVHAEATVLSNMTMGHGMVMKGREDFTLDWHVAYDHHDEHDSGGAGGGGGGGHHHPLTAAAGPHVHGRGDDHDGAEYEIEAAWSHYFDENLTSVLGGRLTNALDAEDRVFAGVSYRLPLLVRAGLQVDSRGDVRVSLDRDVRVTDRLELLLSGTYDTGTHWEGSAGLEYHLTKALSVSALAHSDHGVGIGFTIRF